MRRFGNTARTTFYYGLIIMNSSYMLRLARNLKEFMGDMSLSTLSEEVNIPQPTLSRYLQCKRQITLENLIKLADYFDVDIDILIGRKDY